MILVRDLVGILTFRVFFDIIKAESRKEKTEGRGDFVRTALVWGGAAVFSGLFLGTLLLKVFSLSLAFITVFLLFFAVFVYLFCRVFRQSETRRVGIALAVIFCVFLGLWGISSFCAERNERRLSGAEGTFRLRVEDDGEETANGNVFYSATSEDGSFSGTVRLLFPAGFAPRAFDVVTADVVFFESSDAYVLSRRAKGIAASGYVVSATVTGQRKTVPEEGLLRLRRAVSSALNRCVGERSDVVKALLLGDRSDLSDAATDSVRAAGLSHVLAVSGFHVGMVAFLLMFLLSHVGNPAVRVVLSVSTLVLFAALCGFTPSVVRAVLMVTGSCLTREIFGSRSDSRLGFGCAVLLILLVRPLWIGDVGFQLSVGATAGLLVLFPWLRNAARRHLLRCTGYLARGFVGFVLDTGCMTVSCLLFSAPFACLCFGSIPVTGLVSYLFCIPAVYLAFVSGIFCVVTQFLFPTGFLSHFFGQGAGLGATMFLKISEWFGKISWELDPWALLICLVAGAAVWLVLNASRRPRNRFAVPVLVTVVLLVFSMILPAFFVRNNEIVCVAYVNVGQGMGSAVVEGSRAVILDCGGNAKAGDRMVEYLEKAGVMQIEYVVLSHLHDDHTNGLRALCEAFEIPEIVIPDTIGDEDVYNDVLACAREEQAVVTVLRADETRKFEDVSLLFLTKHFKESTSDPNENSLVCRAETGDVRFLFTGDLTAASEKRLLKEYDASVLSVTVLGVPHHGSPYSSSVAFITVVDPRISVISVGKNNYKHPSSDVVARLAAHGTVYRTDQSGTVEVLTDGKTVEVKTQK